MKNDRLFVFLMSILMTFTSYMLLHDSSTAATITKSYSVLRSNLSQRIDPGCGWDGNTDNIIVMGYYQTMTVDQYNLNELTPTIVPGEGFFLLTFSIDDLTHEGLTLSHVTIMYGEKSC